MSAAERDRILEFIRNSGSKGVTNFDISCFVGGKLLGPHKQILDSLVESGDIFKRNDLLYWSFVHKDFKDVK